jgi:hypothetical protein
VELVAAATLYGLFGAWMLLPYLGARRMLVTSAAVLTWFEFVAVIAWGYSREDCARGSCSALAEAAGTAVAVDLPALAIVVVALAVADAVRRHRSSPKPTRTTSEDIASSK